MPTASYEIPHYSLPSEMKLGWLNDAVAEGDAWLRTQQPTKSFEAVRQLLSSPDGVDKVDGLSSTGYNKAKRVARELVASLAHFKHQGEFGTTRNTQQDLYDQAQVLTTLDRAWEQDPRVEREFRSGIQLGVGFGTGYYHQIWDPSYHSAYRGDIRLTAHRPEDVTFIQLPKTHNMQEAYMVILREELPINIARARYGSQYPAFVASLVPDRVAPSWIAKGLQKVQKFLSPALRVAGKMQQDDVVYPTVDIYHAYTLDRSINTSPSPVEMGLWADDPVSGKRVPLTNWSYRVPALGDPVPTSMMNPQTNQPFTVPAGPAECLLFPLRRYTIWSKTAIAYDGTSPWWHGEVPIARLRFNDWQWEALGSSLIAELQTMQTGIVELIRQIEDAGAARLNPARIVDENRASRGFAETFNPRKAGVVGTADLSAGPVMDFPVPADYYNVPEWITQFIRDQEERMDYIAGVKDLVAVAKAQQIPGADTLEKLLEMAGPIVQDLISQVAEPLQQLGKWRLYYYFQFYTQERMSRYNDDDKLPQAVHYTPDQLRMVTPDQSSDPTELKQRGYIDQFTFTMSQSGMNEIYRMTAKLFYTQLYKLGFPIDPWTLARFFQLANFGPPPRGTNTIMERYQAWKRMEIEMQVELKAQLAQSAAAAGLLGPDAGAGGEGGAGDSGDGGEGDDGGGETPGSTPKGGRPPSFSKAPSIQSKDGGTRSTIATS